MTALVLESIPDQLHARLRAAAAEHRRSPAQEAVVILEKALPAGSEPSGEEAYFTRRQFVPGFKELWDGGKLRGGTDSTQIVSEERDSR